MSKKEKILFFIGFMLMGIVTAAIVIFFMRGENQSPPDGYTKEGYECALKVLEAMDQYNNGELTKEEAETKLDLFDEKIDYINSTMSEDDKKEDKGWKHNALSVDIMMFESEMVEKPTLGLMANEDEYSTFSIADDLRKDLSE